MKNHAEFKASLRLAHKLVPMSLRVLGNFIFGPQPNRLPIERGESSLGCSIFGVFGFSGLQQLRLKCVLQQLRLKCVLLLLH